MSSLDKDLIRDLKHKDYKVRLEAVKKINDDSILADVVKNDSHLDVCLEAVGKISDCSILADVAKNTSDNRVRFEAVKRISDESVLADVTKAFYQEAYAIFKKYDVEPENLQNIAAVNTDCSNFTVIARISDIFGSVNKISGMEKEGPHCFIRIKDNTEIRMIIKEEELNHIQKGNYYIMTHIDCGNYNGTKKLRTTSSTTFTPISETDAKKAISHFPKNDSVRRRSQTGYVRYDYDLLYEEYISYDPYNGFSERPDLGIYCRDDDSWDYGNI